ncbi:extracellular solute-binding protein [Stenoxybacter acetivorans]|uniref:extracellular solute-binding protein n=1 Tax=Stenoxybacter acetivorans TaxID=422441 RepID=UPI000A02CC47|nr:extracellular solute-binding protein [Stenoxybacter acetivorans]
MSSFRFSSLLSLICIAGLAACGGDEPNAAQTSSAGADTGKLLVIYTNADEEAVKAMENALNKNGFDKQYIVQTFGTSELGGKLLAEGKNIEADLVTMSSYYLDSAQAKNQMFQELAFPIETINPHSGFAAPITSQEGAIIVNTKMLADEKLPMPQSIKDLAKPVYRGKLSIIDPNGSSTAWLLVQDVVSAYGDGDEGKAVINTIIENAGNHVEQSGSAPLKKVRAGEVAVGFGLRHQAVADKAKGLPIDFVDPIEGNFALTESLAVVDKGGKTNPNAMKMAEAIIRDGRTELLNVYPNPIYAGESTDNANRSAYPETFSQPLTTELLEQHKAFFHNKY